MNSQNNNLLVTIIMSVAFVAAAILTVPSSVMQLSHAQTNADFQNTILSIHNRERALVGVAPLTWNNDLEAGRPRGSRLQHYWHSSPHQDHG